jgi:elongation factor 3
MVNDMDQKEAAAAGLMSKPLTAANVQKHLENIGLESEFATHSQVRGLSGGQKVKVVIGAAMWMNPHLLVLDEPTNYLDRDSLGALAAAIKEYGGGVLMISHNKEFTDALCPETWVVANGRVDIKGDPAWANAPREKVEFKVQEEMIDAFGNVVKIKAPKKKLSNKEKKAREKMRKARRDRGEDVSESDEEW